MKWNNFSYSIEGINLELKYTFAIAISAIQILFIYLEMFDTLGAKTPILEKICIFITVKIL
mgnify:CR=1 FL=1